MRVLSFGGGVQSSALLLMSLKGELPPYDTVVFADTGWEPQAVYRWVSLMEEEARKSGVPFVRVSNGHIRDDALRYVQGEGTRWPSMPLTVVSSRGEVGRLRRECTEEYKVRPIRRWLREALRKRGERVAHLSLGISLDEVERARPSGVSYVVHEYPLLERRMTREACAAWLKRHGYPEPPKSACIGCPYHGDGYWRRLRQSSPSEWEEAVAFDRAVRKLPRIRGRCYLHRAGVPLEEAVGLPQPDLFGEECFGVCGV